MFKKKYFFLPLLIVFISFLVIIGTIRFLFSTPTVEQNITKLLFKKNSIIYMGDSVLNADHENTSNPSSLVEIFKEGMLTDTLEISGAAYTPYIYQKYIEIIENYNRETKLIVIPINLRAFSSSWTKVPIYQFEQECSILGIVNLKLNYTCMREHFKNVINPNRVKNKQANYLNEKIMSEGFLKTTKRRFFEDVEQDCLIKYKVTNQTLSCKRKKDFDQIMDYMQHGLNLKESMLAMRYNYHYAEKIDEDNSSLIALKNIVNIANNSYFKILFYVTPLNVESMMLHSGEKLIEIIKNNLEVIGAELNGKNIYVLNLVNRLNSEHFDETCACEHVNLQGKKTIINNLTNFIKVKIGNI